MKMKTLEFLRNFQHRLSRSRRWLFVTVVTLCSDSLEHAGSRNRRHSVAASYHHKHPPGPDW
jgi:hypothetical protein